VPRPGTLAVRVIKGRTEVEGQPPLIRGAGETHYARSGESASLFIGAYEVAAVSAVTAEGRVLASTTVTVNEDQVTEVKLEIPIE
jgi:hypothetical protein